MIGNIAITAVTKDEEYLVDAMAPGRKWQNYFICKKEFLSEAEEFFGNTFNYLLQNYGALTCRLIGGGARVEIEQGTIVPKDQQLSSGTKPFLV